MSEETMNDEAQMLDAEDLEQISGGKVVIDPSGSIETEDKYQIINDKTGEVLGKTGGYRRARKIAEQHGQSPDLL